MDQMVGSYLERRGKKRYCDKSLGTARFVELLTRVYPEAKFICLYRHPMDVVASGLEACPWGLNGYGFDGYIASTPGNSVLAMTRFWADNVSAILRAEELFPDRCHRVRYEDMVSDPESVAAGIFAFLEVPPAPGVSASFFAPDRERFGPADYKIWHTSSITGDSVGRGWSIPAGLMGPDMNAVVNELAGKLGYLPVDDNWGTTQAPADLRLPPDAQEPAGNGQEPAAAPVSAAGSQQPGLATDLPPAAGQETGRSAGGGASYGLDAAAGGHAGEGNEVTAEGRLAAEMLTAGLGRLDERFSSRWAPCADETFSLIILPSAKADPPVRWQVDLATREVTAAPVIPAAPVKPATPAVTSGDDAIASADSASAENARADNASAGNGASGNGANGDDDDTAWDIIGPADVWEQVLAGRLNLSVAMRRCQVRYLDAGDVPPAAHDLRIGMLADLLGLTSW